MQQVQNRTFVEALGLDLNSSEPCTKRLVFTMTQIKLCMKLGLDRLFDNQEIMAGVALKKNVTFDKDEHKVSPLLSLIKASFKMVKMIEQQRESSSFFDILARHLVPKGMTKLKPKIRLMPHKSTAVSLLKMSKQESKVVQPHNALVAVSFKSDLAFAKTFLKIAKYNRTHEGVLLMFYEPFVLQLKARVKI